MKQENEITKQLLQKATEGIPYSLLPHKRKQENKPIVASTISMSEMFYDFYDSFNCFKTSIKHILPDSDNTTCKGLPLKVEDEIIFIDDDDELEIPLKKSKPDNNLSYTSHLPPSKNNENYLEGINNDEQSIYKESINNRCNALNNQTSISNNTNELNTSLYANTINYTNLYNFDPIPSTSTNKEAILLNEKRFQNFLTLHASDQVLKQTNSPKIIEECCQPLITNDNTTQELNNKIKSQYDDMDTQQLNYNKESKDTDINTSNINYPNTDVIDPIASNIIDIDKVIAENNLILNKIQNRNKNRIGKLIEVIKTDPEEISPVLNDSSNIEVTVSTIGATTQVEQSGLPASPARTHEDPYSVQSIKRSNNVPHKSSQKSGPKPNVVSRQNELCVSNMLNQITNPSVLPINIPVDRTTNPISQSYNYCQLNNSQQSNENLNTNYNAIKTCNCTQQTQQKSPDKNTQQNVNSIEVKTNLSAARCPICMETLAEKVIASTLCGHLFCMPCIEAALKYPPKKCPTCRRKVSGLGYHQIFL